MKNKDVPKLISQIDLDQPIQTYKVMVSQVWGYLIDVAASNEDDALKYAASRNYYEQYGSRIVDTHYQIFTEEDDSDE